ncbi:MAG: pseudouridine synthase [bacterium]
MKISQYFKYYGLSRRAFLKALNEKRIKVNGLVIQDMSFEVVPEKDIILCDSKKVRVRLNQRVYKFYKPRGIITTLNDPKQRATIQPFLKTLDTPVFPIGRLDRQSTGLLLLTNDGFLAEKVMHPRFEVKKYYRVTLDAVIQKSDILRLQSGVMLEDGPVFFDSVTFSKHSLDVVMTQGRYRVIRRVFAVLGYQVLSLKRYQIGPLQLGTMSPGEIVPLKGIELRQLEQLFD